MESALRQLNIDPSGLTCLDLGMSTGGFTDCLLQWGATQVYGVDVGVGLAHHRLVTDPRVHIIEGTHTKDLTREHIPVPCDICVADISFNALARVVEPATQFLKRGATGILLVKPQFELSASEVNSYGDRGVITDPEAQLLALERSIASITSSGWKFLKSIKSETKGSKGNQEFFLHLEWSGST